MECLFELSVSANAIMEISGGKESFKSIEMSLNKEGVLLDKSKLIVIKIRGMVIMFPIQISRVEIWLRNAIFINEQATLGMIEEMTAFYLWTLSS